MNTRQERARSAPERFMDFGSVTYGDERERTILTEASTFGFSISLYVNLAVALVAAVLGGLALPTVLLLLTAIPAWSMGWYAKQRDVDLEELAARAGPLDRLGTLVTIFGGILLTVGAMIFTILTGNGLVAIPEVVVTGPAASGVWASLVKGAAFGSLGGGVIGFFFLLVNQRRRSRKAAAALPDEEE